MYEVKAILSIIAISLIFVGYTPYLRDTFRGKTTPHIYSWFIWSFATAIIFALQVSAGAGVGAWVTLAVVILGLIVFIAGLRDGRKNITKLDSLFFVLSLVSLFLWIFAKQPVLSAVLISSVDILGFMPTIRKSWNNPYSETLFMYKVGAARHGLAFLALQQYNIVTWLNPIAWVLANSIFSIILIVRRKQVGEQ